VKVLVTGSCGLIGSEAVRFYDKRADLIIGIDNNMRAEFFGQDGDTTWIKNKLKTDCKKYQHLDVDIRDRNRILKIIDELKPDLIIHCAAQPSHDLAAKIPFTDFEVNAVGTLNLLEASRASAPETTFIFMSTNKVYGDAPNRIKLKELKTRWDYDDPRYFNGIPESFTIDQSRHSLFGASKVAADVMVQEYGYYFGMKTVAFRGGCLTGPAHSGAKLHGFLSYLFKTAQNGGLYTIYGYKGKQVRDQIHSVDVIRAFDEFYNNPKCGEVYNLGGGKENTISVLEAIEKAQQLLGKKIDHVYSDENRIGDHIRADFPNWSITYPIEEILESFARYYASLQTSPF
jgi:CDP-paratose 2-epimerase